jgi:phage gpG-like protein
MDAQNIDRIVEKLRKEVLREVNDRLPRKVGVMAVNHFKQNFRDGGWTDNGFTPWKETLRQQSGGPDAKYGPLTSRRNHLMSSIQAKPEPGQVTIENPVPYAGIHNEGGKLTTHPTVTPRMRAFAWHMVYSLSGIKRGGGKLPDQLSPEASKWKGLALTRKTNLTIHANIPKRRFMGDSKELRVKIANEITQTLKRIKDGITALTAH